MKLVADRVNQKSKTHISFKLGYDPRTKKYTIYKLHGNYDRFAKGGIAWTNSPVKNGSGLGVDAAIKLFNKKIAATGNDKLTLEEVLSIVAKIDNEKPNKNDHYRPKVSKQKMLTAMMKIAKDDAEDDDEYLDDLEYYSGMSYNDLADVYFQYHNNQGKRVLIKK